MSENTRISSSRKPTTEKLLIADDSDLNRIILSNIFDDDHTICEAADGRAALDIIHQQGESLSAILLDVVMPEMDGIQVLRTMKAEGLLDKIPVFLVTAQNSSDITREAYDLGVMDVITKPVVSYVVRRRVNSIIELFRARRRLSAEVEWQQDKILDQAKRLTSLSVGMLESLATAIEFRSDESGAHVRRIHDGTVMLLKKTALGDGISPEQIDQIGIASITHDVGKIAIPDAILNKPGRLTKEEFEIMKTHTVQGARLLSEISQLKDFGAYQYAYDIALYHHERWDGGGYPEGLKGDEIPIWAQIVSLVDVYDALVSKRCYKDAYPFNVALQMILDGKCGQFNPKLLHCFFHAEPSLRALYRT